MLWFSGQDGDVNVEKDPGLKEDLESGKVGSWIFFHKRLWGNCHHRGNNKQQTKICRKKNALRWHFQSEFGAPSIWFLWFMDIYGYFNLAAFLVRLMAFVAGIQYLSFQSSLDLLSFSHNSRRTSIWKMQRHWVARWIFDRNGGFSQGESFANQSLRGGFKYVFMFFLIWGDDLQLGWNHQVGQEWCALNGWIWYTFGIFSGLAEKRFVKFLLRRTLLQLERFTLPETNIAPKNGGFP